MLVDLEPDDRRGATAPRGALEAGVAEPPTQPPRGAFGCDSTASGAAPRQVRVVVVRSTASSATLLRPCRGRRAESRLGLRYRSWRHRSSRRSCRWWSCRPQSLAQWREHCGHWRASLGRARRPAEHRRAVLCCSANGEHLHVDGAVAPRRTSTRQRLPDR